MNLLVLWYLLESVLGNFGNTLEEFGAHNEIFNIAYKELEANYNPDSECIKYAFKEISEKCKTQGIDSLGSTERKFSTLKLTLCEMDNLNLEPPKSCKNMMNERDYNECIRSLEKIPQYWTSFSGNYRDINKICHEQSLPYEKDQIIKLYTNITKVFQKLQNEVSNSFKDSEQFQNILQTKLNDLMDMANTITSKLTKVQEDMMEDLKESAMELKTNFENSLNVLQSFNIQSGADVKEIAVNLNFLNVELSQILNNLIQTNIQESISDLQNTVNDQCNEIRDIVSDTASTVKNKVADLIDNIDTKEKRLQTNLNTNEEISKRINQLLSNVEVNALQQRDSLEFNNDHLNNILNQLLGSLEYSFRQTEQRMDTVLDTINHKASKILNIMDQTNAQIEYLILYLNSGTAIFKNSISWVSNQFTLLMGLPLKLFNIGTQFLRSGTQLFYVTITILGCLILIRTLSSPRHSRYFRPIILRVLMIIYLLIMIISITILEPNIMSKTLNYWPNVEMSSKKVRPYLSEK